MMKSTTICEARKALFAAGRIKLLHPSRPGPMVAKDASDVIGVRQAAAYNDLADQEID